MHPTRARETTPAGRAEANHGIRAKRDRDTDSPVGNAATACADNDAAPLISNDADLELAAVE
jgi:hypothetical protein